MFGGTSRPAALAETVGLKMDVFARMLCVCVCGRHLRLSDVCSWSLVYQRTRPFVCSCLMQNIFRCVRSPDWPQGCVGGWLYLSSVTVNRSQAINSLTANWGWAKNRHAAHTATYRRVREVQAGLRSDKLKLGASVCVFADRLKIGVDSLEWTYSTVCDVFEFILVNDGLWFWRSCSQTTCRTECDCSQLD